MQSLARKKRKPETAGPQPAVSGPHKQSTGEAGSLAAICGTISVAALFLLCGVMTADVVARYFFIRPISWSGEVVKFLMSIIFFAALPIASWRNDHIVVDIISRRFVGRLKSASAFLVNLVSAALMALFAWYGFDFAARLMKYGDRTFSLGLPLHYAAWAAAAAFAIAAMAFLVHAWAAIRRGR